MPEQAALDAMRAVVETIAPATDRGPGAADLDVHRHVAESIDAALPGFLEMLVMLLDAYASDVSSGTPFTELAVQDRSRVLRAMAAEQTQEMQEVVGALFLFTYGGLYSEWTGYDRASGELSAPWTWRALDHRGPVRGNPEYRREGPA